MSLLMEKTKNPKRRRSLSELSSTGWQTSDAEEIERRRLRGIAEPMAIESIEKNVRCFGSYSVRSENGKAYCVEFRSTTEQTNSCDCPDYLINGLGTCKHIEAVRYHLEQSACFVSTEKSSRIEIFVDLKAHEQVRVQWPAEPIKEPLRELLAPFFSADGSLIGCPGSSIRTIRHALRQAPASLRNKVRISRGLDPWIAEQERREERVAAKHRFEKDLREGKRSLDVINAELYPYQREGVLHLAFGERAMLGDEMGLGKTVQAIAAAELLRRLRGVERVLIIAPTSLKTEWEEQIQQFTNLPTCMIQGQKPARLSQYRQNAFFYLANYEQVRIDIDAIEELLAPDLVIIDEAQRIKNWQTQTAQAVRRLSSPYLFVLSGTPLENHIDEIYSIMQVIDPKIFGPLFRFNRSFYQLDGKGQPFGYKNLDLLHRTLRPVLLRRQRSEVNDQLPPRTINTYFVDMSSEQEHYYKEHNERLQSLIRRSRSQSLRKEERDAMQRALACMRMICDTPYILDRKCKSSPKIDELRELLPELLSRNEKIVIYSEWERMLELVKELAEELGIEYAWHTGSVPQEKRRFDIRRFKGEPKCRLFLSTDAGSTGLNLQMASAVINLDLPWNPAKLEQRIGRAWRAKQTKAVHVVNLVCKDSIEHRLIQTLANKQQLADKVLDGKGNQDQMLTASRRSTLIDELTAQLTPGKSKAKEPSGKSQLQDLLLSRYRDSLLRLERVGDSLVAVVDDRKAIANDSLVKSHPQNTLQLFDRQGYLQLLQLIESGVIQWSDQKPDLIYQSQSFIPKPRNNEKQVAYAKRKLAAAQRRLRMAEVLADGSFFAEALPPAEESIDLLEDAAEALELSPHKIPIKKPLNEEQKVAETIQLANRLISQIEQQV